MSTADCPACGAPVITAELAGEATGRVVLDRHETSTGTDRFAVWDDGRARPVVPNAAVLAFPLHRCAAPVRA